MANKQPRNRNWCHQYNIGEGDEMNTPLYEALKTSIKEYFNDRYADIVKNIEKLSTLEDFYKYDMEQAIYWYAYHYHGGFAFADGATDPLYDVILSSVYKPAPNEVGPENGLATDFYEFLIEEATEIE